MRQIAFLVLLFAGVSCASPPQHTGTYTITFGEAVSSARALPRSAEPAAIREATKAVGHFILNHWTNVMPSGEFAVNLVLDIDGTITPEAITRAGQLGAEFKAAMLRSGVPTQVVVLRDRTGKLFTIDSTPPA